MEEFSTLTVNILFYSLGINSTDLYNHTNTHGGIASFPGCTLLEKEEVISKECDILIPAFTEMTINKNNMKDVKAKIILEVANSPVTFEADKYLAS
jgi:glutamate dehydrogenase/leucine dehydrogenase